MSTQSASHTPLPQPVKSLSLFPSPQPSYTSDSPKHQSTRPLRSKSLPIIIPSPPPTPKNDPTVYPKLPNDPKTWTSDHVAQYLTYCLRLYPPAIIRDLTRYVSEEHTLTGKRFMRLKEENLRRMNFNERWVKLIMMGVKALRRQSLKDKILGGQYDKIVEEDIEDIEDLSDEDSEIESQDYNDVLSSDPLSSSSTPSSPQTPSPSSEKEPPVFTSLSETTLVNRQSAEDEITIQSGFAKSEYDILRNETNQQNMADSLSTLPNPSSNSHAFTGTTLLPPPNTASTVQRFSWSYIFSRPFSLSRIIAGLLLLKQEILETLPNYNSRFSQGFFVGGFVVWAWTRITGGAKKSW